MGAGELGCGGTMMKYILFIFNFVFFIVGGAIFGVAIWLMVDETATDFQDLVDNSSMKAALIVLLCVGIFIFLVGFLGCCGACKESSTMLCLYGFLMIVLFIGEIAAAVLAIVFNNELNDTLQTKMSEQVTNDVKSTYNTSLITQTWFRTQVELECCGGKDFTDYKNNTAFGQTSLVIPKQCCKLKNKKKPLDPEVNDYAKCQTEARSWDADKKYDELYSKGCYPAMKDWLNDKTTILIGFGFGVAAIQIFGIVFACCVRNEIKGRGDYN